MGSFIFLFPLILQPVHFIYSLFTKIIYKGHFPLIYAKISLVLEAIFLSKSYLEVLDCNKIVSLFSVIRF
jgi:hypothetical protein